jgi:hypothetical protein
LVFFGAISNLLSHGLFAQHSGATVAGSKDFDYAGLWRGDGKVRSNWGFVFSLAAVKYLKAIQTIIQDVRHYAYCGLNLSKSCVVGTFEFLISAHPNPKSTTLGIPLGGQPDKTRQVEMMEFKPVEI